MNKNLIIVEQQSSHSNANQHNDKYVISTSLIRETRSYHLLGVRDYINNRELSVQEAIRLGILDKQNGQYINKKTNEYFFNIRSYCTRAYTCSTTYQLNQPHATATTIKYTRNNLEHRMVNVEQLKKQKLIHLKVQYILKHEKKYLYDKVILLSV